MNNCIFIQNKIVGNFTRLNWEISELPIVGEIWKNPILNLLKRLFILTVSA
jgi:hypothetical protein